MTAALCRRAADPVGTAGFRADSPALRLAAWSLLRSKGALGAPKAITAAAHQLGRIVYHLMRFGKASVKRTEAAYGEEVRERQERQLERRAKELGFAVKKIETPPAEPPGAG